MAIDNFYDQMVSWITLTTGSWGTTATRSTAATFLAAVNPYGDERYAADKKTVFADYKMFCDAAVTLNEGDLIRWNAKDYRVVSVKNTFSMGHHKRVALKRQS